MNPRRLELSELDLTGGDLAALLTGEVLNTVTELDLGFNPLGNAGCAVLFDLLAGATHSVRLILTCCDISLLPPLPLCVRAMDLSWNPVYDCPALSPNLRELNLSFTQLDDDQAEELLMGIQTTSLLVELGLEGNFIDEELICEVNQALAANRIRERAVALCCAIDVARLSARSSIRRLPKDLARLALGYLLPT
ncbi:hypothetical protein BASA81_000514 [Batrachochytrium salamandrivorans]|nr:hypothetical protein BASA81_000514 [Batrachochytrium salamandrivorans]